MNLKRFWIATGALATFVVGVSLVAYGTGKFVSEASPAGFTDTGTKSVELKVDPVPTQNSVVGSGVGLNPGVTDINGNPLSTTPAPTATTTPASTSPANTPASSASFTGKSLSAVGTAPAVDLSKSNFLQKNFASVDNILQIGIPRLLISLAGLIALVMFLINAAKYLFNAGNEQGTEEAKKGLQFTAIGLVIVVLAYLAVSLGASIFK